MVSLFFSFVIFLSCARQKKAEPINQEETLPAETISPVAQDVENRMSEAMELMAKGQATEGATLLLDVILLAGPRATFPEGFETLITQARERYQAGSLSEAVETISRALDLLQPPQQQIKERKGEIAPLAEKFRENILAAKQEFRKGNADQGIRLILISLKLLAPRTDRENIFIPNFR